MSKYFLLLSILIFSTCSSSIDTYVDEAVEGPYESIEGTVSYVEVEGGTWAILTDSLTYQPLNLPESFTVEGLNVNIEGVIRPDIGSYFMIGPILEIHKIEEIKK